MKGRRQNIVEFLFQIFMIRRVFGEAQRALRAAAGAPFGIGFHYGFGTVWYGLVSSSVRGSGFGVADSYNRYG